MCDNPWRHKKCTNTDIAVIINYKGQELEICHKCHIKISESDVEWGEDKNYKYNLPINKRMLSNWSM